MLDILVLMAGQGQRFIRAGYDRPKPLIELHGKPMVAHIIDNLATDRGHRFIFACLEQHVEQHGLREQLREWAPESRIVTVPSVTAGAACTALLASEQFRNDCPLLIANSDQLVDMALDDFLDDADKRGLDGSILTFPADDPKWSFAKTDEKGFVTEVAEKVPISAHATVGLYWFRRSALYIAAAEQMILAEKRVRGEFYVCPVYNELIARGGRVGIYEIPAGAMHGLGTPEDMERYLARFPELRRDLRPAHERPLH